MQSRNRGVYFCCKILYFINFVIFVIVSLKGTVTLQWVIVLQFTSKSHVNSILYLLFLWGSHSGIGLRHKLLCYGGMRQTADPHSY